MQDDQHYGNDAGSDYADALPAGQTPDAEARDAHTFQVASHGVDVLPMPKVPFDDPASTQEAAELAADHADASAPARSHKARQETDRFTMRDFFVWCGIPVLVVLLIRIFLFGSYVIPSGSMLDTIEIGDRVVTTKLVPKVFDLKRGDIVVFKDPSNWLGDETSRSADNEFLIKRLIGLPGDTVACLGDGQPVTVNGVAIDESSYIRPGVTPSAFPFSVTVSEGHVFVMGDNRANSADSRYHLDDANHGLVPISDVVGSALLTYWPLNRVGTLDAHHDVFDAVPDPAAAAS